MVGELAAAVVQSGGEPSGRGAPEGILVQALREHRQQAFGHTVQVGFGVLHPVQQVRRLTVPEGRTPGGGEDEQPGEREDVTGGRVLLPARLLG